MKGPELQTNRVQDTGFRVHCTGFCDSQSLTAKHSSMLPDKGLELQTNRVQGTGYRVQGTGYRALSLTAKRSSMLPDKVGWNQWLGGEVLLLG